MKIGSEEEKEELNKEIRELADEFEIDDNRMGHVTKENLRKLASYHSSMSRKSDVMKVVEQWKVVISHLVDLTETNGVEGTERQRDKE